MSDYSQSLLGSSLGLLPPEKDTRDRVNSKIKIYTQSVVLHPNVLKGLPLENAPTFDCRFAPNFVIPFTKMHILDLKGQPLRGN